MYRSYSKEPVFFNNGSDMNFDSAYVQMFDFVKSLHFTTEDPLSDIKVLHASDWNASNEPPLHLAYQTADTICFSRKSSDTLGSVRLIDLIIIDSSVIRFYQETEMKIFVHYPGQLITSFEKAKYSTSFAHLISVLNGTTPKVLEFKLTENKRLKKRHDSNEPCNRSIQNYDQFLKNKISEKLMDEIGCLPTYLKPYQSNHSIELKNCISAEDLQKAYKIMENVKAILEEYEPPCDEMLILSIDSMDNNPSPIPEDISIKFVYSERVYEEIQYIQAIVFENWLSNVGGFVGIFLGYSMMQFPEFLLIFSTTFNTKRGKLWIGMLSFMKNICKVLIL